MDTPLTLADHASHLNVTDTVTALCVAIALCVDSAQCPYSLVIFCQLYLPRLMREFHFTFTECRIIPSDQNYIDYFTNSEVSVVGSVC